MTVFCATVGTGGRSSFSALQQSKQGNIRGRKGWRQTRVTHTRGHTGCITGTGAYLKAMKPSVKTIG